MPTPSFEADDSFMDSPQKALEILGVGRTARKSKTVIDTMRGAYILSRIRTHLRMLIDMLARAHARHYTRPVYAENEAGELVEIGREPEWLNDQEIISKYTAARAWFEAHQEIVDHNPSVKGFSIRATTHLPDEESKRRPESSAGAERPTGNERW